MIHGGPTHPRLAARALLLLACLGGRCGALTLSADFDSASLDLAASGVSGAVVSLVGRDNFNPGEWKWLYFRLDGAAGQTPLFEISDNFATGDSNLNDHQMVYSYDGQSWEFFDNNQRSAGEDLYRFSNATPFASDAVYVAYGLPYATSRAADLVSRALASPWGGPTQSADPAGVVGASPGGVDDVGRTIAPRPLSAFRIADPAGVADRPKVVLAGGVHANETLGNLMLEGMVDYLLGDSLEAGLLRKAADFYVYPMANPDGRYAGMNRGTVADPSLDPNRFWAGPGYGGIEELQTLGAAMIADTGADADYVVDFHSTVNGKDGHFGYVLPAMQSDPVWQNLLALEPGVDTRNASLINDTLAKFGRDTLGADFSITFETQFIAGENVDRFLALGENLGRAFFRSLTQPGDLNLDGLLTADDWALFIAHAETDLAGLPAADAYLRGDLNADGFNDIYDFQLFKDAYEAANGVGAFAQMIAAPEPSALAMTTFALLRLAPVIRRPQRC